MFSAKEKAVISGFFVSLLISFSGFSGKCEKISDKVLRLHIIANSDSEEDQNLKLQLRDRILQTYGRKLENVGNLQDAVNTVDENKQGILHEAQTLISEQGYKYSVAVQLVDMHFNTRNYGKITLPAGKYRALRITIGECKGKNWWCVMFPPMCLPAAQEQTQINDVLNPGELDIVEGEEKYEVKFKFMEIFDDVRKHIFSFWD